ncbi:hypothetical protein [Legionella moravica]|uniref:hypothetical protein n=1 Tax=Legionella moravica TaxID=39962 RepID=UPI000410D6E5|nr:hypothetical protein [Legionella moravica]
MIVGGAHGRYYINEYVVRTTSGLIIRQSPVPLLLIKKEPDFACNRIVIATDLTEASKEIGFMVVADSSSALDLL